MRTCLSLDKNVSQIEEEGKGIKSEYLQPGFLNDRFDLFVKTEVESGRLISYDRSCRLVQADREMGEEFCLDHAMIWMVYELWLSLVGKT